VAVHDRLISSVNYWWGRFFDSSVSELLQKVTHFLSRREGSPFPVLVHVLPPQEAQDASYFLDGLKTIGVPVVTHRLHHIQQDCTILFDPASPPSDVPRVLAFFYCYDETVLFDRFISAILEILFGFGLAPRPTFVGVFRSLYFDKFRSFSFLMTILRQSLFAHFQTFRAFDFSEVFECPVADFVPSFLRKAAHSRDLPTAMIVKLRSPILSALRVLCDRFKQPSILTEMLSFEDLGTCPGFHKLADRMAGIADAELRGSLLAAAPILRPLFGEEQSAPQEVSLKTRKGRMAAFVGQTTVRTTCISIFQKIVAKAFLNVPDDSPCQFDLCDAATFDPRKAMAEMMADEDVTSDTAIAFQIIAEQTGKFVEISDLLGAFSAKMDIQNEAVSLSRVEVAISELEYLGFVDRKGRKKGSLRRILRV
jgi:hypothetical protein